jgi:hypothetical protein
VGTRLVASTAGGHMASGGGEEACRLRCQVAVDMATYLMSAALQSGMAVKIDSRESGRECSL